MKKLFVLLAFALPVLLLLLACNAPPTNIPPTSTSAPVPGLRNLVSGTITVKAGNFYDIQFIVDKTMRNPEVSGVFKVSGGAVNNIEVLIMDDNDFGEWKNAHKENNLFTSERVNSGNISAFISTPGNYHLVFDNSPSLLTPKRVLAVVDLTWSR